MPSGSLMRVPMHAYDAALPSALSARGSSRGHAGGLGGTAEIPPGLPVPLGTTELESFCRVCLLPSSAALAPTTSRVSGKSATSGHSPSAPSSGGPTSSMAFSSGKAGFFSPGEAFTAKPIRGCGAFLADTLK
jgi:hypothetical protein